MKKLSLLILFFWGYLCSFSAEPFITFRQNPDFFPVITDGSPCPILSSDNEDKGIQIAIANLQDDFMRVTGKKAVSMTAPGSERQYIIIGSMESPVIKNLFKAKKMDKKALAGKNEKYIIQVVEQPQDGIDRALVIAGGLGLVMIFQNKTEDPAADEIHETDGIHEKYESVEDLIHRYNFLAENTVSQESADRNACELYALYSFIRATLMLWHNQPDMKEVASLREHPELLEKWQKKKKDSSRTTTTAPNC